MSLTALSAQKDYIMPCEK